MASANVYLSGGPCDGKTIPRPKTDAGVVAACGGHTYVASTPAKYRPNGDEIFHDVGATNPTGGNVKTAQLHHGWADLRRSVNATLPRALHNSQRNLNAGLRAVGRARKVRL